MDKTPQTLVALFQKMYDLTRPECDNCRCPRSCCSEEYCEMAAEIATEVGVALVATGHATLPYMGENGCVVPPHLRPLCTLHTCDINGAGHHKTNMKWTTEYFILRDAIDEASLLHADIVN